MHELSSDHKAIHICRQLRMNPDDLAWNSLMHDPTYSSSTPAISLQSQRMGTVLTALLLQYFAGLEARSIAVAAS